MKKTTTNDTFVPIARDKTRKLRTPNLADKIDAPFECIECRQMLCLKGHCDRSGGPAKKRRHFAHVGSWGGVDNCQGGQGGCGGDSKSLEHIQAKELILQNLNIMTLVFPCHRCGHEKTFRNIVEEGCQEHRIEIRGKLFVVDIHIPDHRIAIEVYNTHRLTMDKLEFLYFRYEHILEISADLAGSTTLVNDNICRTCFMESRRLDHLKLIWNHWNEPRRKAKEALRAEEVRAEIAVKTEEVRLGKEEAARAKEEVTRAIEMRAAAVRVATRAKEEAIRAIEMREAALRVATRATRAAEMREAAAVDKRASAAKVERIMHAKKKREEKRVREQEQEKEPFRVIADTICVGHPLVCRSTATYLLKNPSVYRCTAINPRQWIYCGETEADHAQLCNDLYTRKIILGGCKAPV